MSSIAVFMEFILVGEKRETIRDPMYKKAGKDGRVYIRIWRIKRYWLSLQAYPKDKIDCIKVGRSAELL